MAGPRAPTGTRGGNPRQLRGARIERLGPGPVARAPGAAREGSAGAPATAVERGGPILRQLGDIARTDLGFSGIIPAARRGEAKLRPVGRDRRRGGEGGRGGTGDLEGCRRGAPGVLPSGGHGVAA